MAAVGILKELQFIGLAVLSGMLLLILYDMLRIVRRVIAHGVWAVAVEDLCYWMAAVVLVFQLIYQENDGALRGYALFALGVGMAVYHWSVSSWLVEHISIVLNVIYGVIKKPVGLVVGKTSRGFRQWIRFSKKKLKNKIKEFIIILFS